MANESPKKSLPWLILLAAITCIGLFFVFGKGSGNVDDTDLKNTYVVKEGAKLLGLKAEDLDQIQTMVVVSPFLHAKKDVAVRNKGEAFATLYQKVNAEGFHFFSDKIISPYIESNSHKSKEGHFNLLFLNELKGVGALLGIDRDPTAQIVKKRGVTIWSSVSGMLGFIIMIIIIFAIIMHMQGSIIKNDIKPVLPDEMDDDLDDLVGMEDIKAELGQLQEMILHRELYEGFGIHKAFNVMMTGPAGTGKTKTARCLAKLTDCPLYYISASSLETGFVGGGSKTLRSMHKKASKHKRAIIFLDEAENVFRSRKAPTQSRHENDTMNTLLALLDGVKVSKSGEVIWIVASNFDEHSLVMDEAMLRRFHLKVNFRLPNMREREQILINLMAKKDADKIDKDINLKHIATITSGMSPASLETMVLRSGLIAIQEGSIINQNVMLKAFERVAVGLTDRATSGDIDSKRKIIAIHESGHFVAQLHNALIKCNGDLSELSEHLHVLKISTEAVSSVGALGFVLSKGEELPLPSRRDMEEQIVELYGGVANEEIFLGEAGVTAGAHNDIQKVTRLLSLMFNEVGYYTSAKLNFITLKDSGLDSTRQRMSEITSRAESLYDYTLDLLKPYKSLTTMITERLMDNFVINQYEIMGIINAYFEDNADQLLAYQQSAVQRPSYQAILEDS